MQQANPLVHQESVSLPQASVTLVPLEPDDREQFITEHQEAVYYGAVEEFGCRDEHFEEDGGAVIRVDGTKGELELLFVTPHIHSKGVGYAAWCEIEKLHPEVTLWETCTPYFETRNIHFYVNRCGFHIVEFFNSHHKDPNYPEAEYGEGMGGSDEMFRVEKVMKKGHYE